MSSFNDPLDGSFNPLDSPGSGSGTAAVEDTGPRYVTGQFVETTMPNTAFSGMPVVGTAGFEGAARLGVDPAGAGNQAVTQKGHRGDPVPQPQPPLGIGDDDLGGVIGHAALAP